MAAELATKAPYGSKITLRRPRLPYFGARGSVPFVTKQIETLGSERKSDGG